jgi:Sec7-like guanine-nucleotide exchange factor
MFQLVWRRPLAVFSMSFEASGNEKIIKSCLSGLTSASHIASHCYCEDALATIVDCFSKFTRLRSYLDDVQPKNIACTIAFLQVAASDRNFLRGAWSIVMAEVSAVDKSQYFPVPDVLFTGSMSLDRESIIDYVHAMCDISNTELREEPPRSFLLVKLADVAYFNLNRWKVVWEEIWAIMGEYLIQVASNEAFPENVLHAAVNVIWQIARKFMAQKETEAFHFQEHFMRPFFEIFLAQPLTIVKELIVTCCTGLVDECYQTLKSGWTAVFQILAQASKDFRPKGYRLLVNIIENHMKCLSHGQMLHLISIVMAFVVNGSEDKACPRAVSQFVKIAKELGEDDELMVVWDCLFASLGKCLAKGSPAVKNKVVSVAIAIASDGKMPGQFRETIVPDRLIKFCEAIADIPKLEAALAQHRQKIKDMTE